MQYETLKEAGYTHIQTKRPGVHLLLNDSEKYEVWYANKYHASYGLIYKNTHLEFGCSIEVKKYTLTCGCLFHIIDGVLNMFHSCPEHDEEEAQKKLKKEFGVEYTYITREASFA